MTILIVLLGLLLSHLVPPLARRRNFGWFARLIGLVRVWSADRTWAPAAAVVIVAPSIAVAASAIAVGFFGTPGWFMLALAVFIYTLGPRDLDHDVQLLLAGGNNPAYLTARRVMRIRHDAGSDGAAAAVLHAAQTRWFGILFWFVTLGIAGALLYRLTRLSLHLPGLSPEQSAWLLRLRLVLDWPVLVLMLISAGLGGDLDRVRQAWRVHVAGRSGWAIRDDVLDETAALIVDPAGSFEDGVTTGHHLVWRMLLIWLVVLSLLLIAGWLS
ncbi:MAG: hypothetical protein LC637_07180 [Xanthomonadaceae bacterium]|nr:hypothetical protein [Xanthomonadaceae bacterium]